ncbi:Ribonuclease H-like superfamily protein [Rhynchospora pubera]|uniref:Ribonuclease H-like superfamily protein n=1 Tax=Rhynchospora pubera TaxID=906938 RepID=A0AAV8F971_9POAL|nr:Ribonuclease H-like superfamily protein [Rhynchospora pubera]
MPLVAWKRVTQPKAMGGLGLRDVLNLNRSLTLKALWAVATRNPAIWVNVVTTKYLSKNTLWQSNRTYKCTALWRGLLAARKYLEKQLLWQIGDGKSCKVFGDPWHELWRHFNPSGASQRRMVVADLIRAEDSSWNIPLLIQLFGFHGALYLAMTFSEGLKLNSHPDRPIFKASANGKFTLKRAYAAICAEQGSPSITPQAKQFMKLIWGSQGILPRIRIFLWKIAWGALPVDQLFVQRLAKQSQGCPICGYEKENIVHSLFKCPVARRAWLSSDLGLRTEDLPEDPVQLLLLLSDNEDVFRKLVYILWCYWKARCKQVYEGTAIREEKVLAHANGLSKMETLAQVVFSGLSRRNQEVTVQARYCCYIDGSWVHDRDNGAAWGYVLFMDDVTLVQYQMAAERATSSFHAELLALRSAVQAVQSGGYMPCIFCTDCENLYRVISGALDAAAMDWRVYHDILQLVQSFSEGQGLYCKLVSRDDNQLADSIARNARLKGIASLGYTYPIM